MDGPANVAVGGVERFQGRAAGEFDPLEAELSKFSLLCLADDAAVALDAGFAKSVHCCILRLLFGDALHFQGNITTASSAGRSAAPLHPRTKKHAPMRTGACKMVRY